MNIERLNKAATAAGFAMATPEDDLAVESVPAEPTQDSRAVVLVTPPPPRIVETGALAATSAWIKGYLATFGWRQPA